MSHKKVAGKCNGHHVDDEKISFKIHRFRFEVGENRFAPGTFIKIVSHQHVKFRNNDERTKAVFVDF